MQASGGESSRGHQQYLFPGNNEQIGKALNRYESSPLTHCSGGENEAMDQGSKILGGKAVLTLTSKTTEAMIFLPFKGF